MNDDTSPVPDDPQSSPECPSCKAETAGDALRCTRCGYGVAPDLTPRRRRPAYIGDDGSESAENAFGRTYRCSRCGSYGAAVRRIATTGAGLSKVLDFQHNDFVITTCGYCCAVQLFDPSVLGRTGGAFTVLDLLS